MLDRIECAVLAGCLGFSLGVIVASFAQFYG
jgi:hypothetical protein